MAIKNSSGLRLAGMTAFVCFLFVSPVSAEIFTLFSDKGLPVSNPGEVIAFGGGGGFFDGNSTNVTPPEGLESWWTLENIGLFAGWGINYGTPRDLSQFSNGELRFWVYSSTGNINVEMKNSLNAIIFQKNLTADGFWDWNTMHDQWVHMRMPLGGITMSSIKNPFLFTVIQGPATFYIDNVRYVDSAAIGFMGVTLHQIADNTAATDFSWNAALPAG